MNHKAQIIKYLSFDFLSALLSWILFYHIIINHSTAGQNLLHIKAINRESVFITGMIIYPTLWLLIYTLWGFYSDTFRRSRLKELGASITVTLAGSLAIFTLLISSDIITGVSGNLLSSFLTLFSIHLIVSYPPRLAITTFTIIKIRKGILGFNTLIIGSDRKAVNIFKEINSQIRPTGNRFIGFISINGGQSYPLSRFLKHLGGLDSVNEVISKYKVQEVILAIESYEHSKIGKIISRLDNQSDVVIKAIPGMHDILTGRIRIDTIIETPLIKISHKFMPVWQNNLKQVLDFVFSFFMLALFFPVSILIMIWIKLTSRGPVIHSHERIGKNGKPFMIYKFRTMIENAETNGPELSSASDKRVTRQGRFLRRMRLDEIPNFINVLKGDMSVVGPRPERRYYIDQIVKIAPHYNQLLKIKPGITSWGQVKYGYAENVEQMTQRLKYDMIYLDNMSLFVDFQILILTVLIIFKQRGV